MTVSQGNALQPIATACSRLVIPFGRRFGMQQDSDGLEPSTLQSRLHRLDRHILNLIPESAGPRLATSRGGAIYAVREPGAQTLLAESHFAEVMLAPAPGIQAALGSDRMQEYDAPAGALLIHPANVEGRAVWSCTRESVIVAVRPESLLELAANELDADHVSLEPPPFGTVDLVALHIAQLLKIELTRKEPANELWVASLVMLFSMHLLRNYSKVKKSAPIRRSGLSVRDARKVQEFLHENFTRKLSVGEMAVIAGLSPFHFIRAFSKTFGKPPHQYVLNLRLAFAEQLLLEGNISIAEIASLSGFSDQSHLTAAMRKHRHATPAQIRHNR